MDKFGGVQTSSVQIILHITRTVSGQIVDKLTETMNAPVRCTRALVLYNMVKGTMINNCTQGTANRGALNDTSHSSVQHANAPNL